MSLASAAGALLKSQTPLQQLLEDINFQRTKEMRQLLKDDSGFVVLQGTTYWTDLFVRHFLFQSEPAHSIDSDDLLFFVRKKHVKSSSRHMPKYETEVDVFRKDSRKLPIGDPDVDWEETVYLNMVIHQFDYTLTLAICTRTSPKELQVLRRHSQRVYASPSRRKMDTKGEGEEMTYPHICFMVDNFDEVFSDILVRDGEMVCVELVANDKDGSVQGVIFLGSIRYDALKKVYDARQSSLSSKVAQRMSFGLFSSGAGVQTRCEFVRMKGPQGKGHAEMAVTKPKGSGVETPTSEPGYCATDMWDDWDEDNDDYCTYRHQRRLSDPSANLNNFSRYAWRTKNAHDAPSGSAGSKARSENEGLDSLASEVSEIEAGDLRDDQGPAFSASETKLHCNVNCDIKPNTLATIDTPSSITTKIETIDTVNTSIITSPQSTTTGCSNCFGGGGKKCKRWSSSSSSASAQMSEIYCPTCEDPSNETPACLNKMPDRKLKPKHKTILSVESELVVGKGSTLLNEPKKRLSRSTSITPTSGIDKNKKLTQKKIESPKNDKIKSKEKVTVTVKSAAKAVTSKLSPKRTKSDKKSEKFESTTKKKKDVTVSSNNNDAITTTQDFKEQEYEIADDATSLNGGELTNSKSEAKIAILSDQDTMLMINVRGKEELPVVEEPTQISPTPSPTSPLLNIETTAIKQELISSCHPYRFEKCVPAKSDSHPLQLSVNENVVIKSAVAVDNIDNNDSQELLTEVFENTPMLGNDCNGNCDDETSNHAQPCTQLSQTDDGTTTSDSNGEHFSFKRNFTLPRIKKTTVQQSFYNRALNLVPKRRTPDGTNIYYWCDLSEKALKELDDGAYNPLWASRGFTQTFHFWKENRRQQSTPLNAFLTYVTLPWWSIAKDLLDHRETPILTF